MTAEKRGELVTPKDCAAHFERKLKCNCNLDNWEPEQSTGHSHVCRIHRAAMRAYCSGVFTDDS